MVKIFFIKADTPLTDSEKENILFHYPKELSDYVKRASDPVRRALAYGALLEALETDGSGFSLKDGGKPYIKEALPFSLSYSDGIICIAVSEGGAIGVDIEAYQSEKEQTYKRLSRRFNAAEKIPFTRMNFGNSGELYTVDSLSKKEICISFYEIKFSGGEFIKKPLIPTISKNHQLDFWVKTEAVLKMEGGGFSSYRNIEKAARGATLICDALDLWGRALALGISLKD